METSFSILYRLRLESIAARVQRRHWGGAVQRGSGSGGLNDDRQAYSAVRNVVSELLGGRIGAEPADGAIANCGTLIMI